MQLDTNRFISGIPFILICAISLPFQRADLGTCWLATAIIILPQFPQHLSFQGMVRKNYNCQKEEQFFPLDIASGIFGGNQNSAYWSTTAQRIWLFFMYKEQRCYYGLHYLCGEASASVPWTSSHWENTLLGGVHHPLPNFLGCNV